MQILADCILTASVIFAITSDCSLVHSAEASVEARDSASIAVFMIIF